MSLAIATYAAPRYPPATAAGSNTAGPRAAGRLSTAEQAVVDKLAARDRQVRQHEQAHLAAAGGLALSAASFTYQRGPDGANYAVGGEVRIDTSPGRTPEETLRRAETIRAAALAPADPSGQDRAVAAEAASMALEARGEIAQEAEPAPSGGESERRAAAVGRYYGAAANPAGAINTYA